MKTILTIGLALVAGIASAQIVISPVTNSVVSIPPTVLNSNQTAQLVTVIATNAAAAGILFQNVNVLDGKQHQIIFTVKQNGTSVTRIK